MKKLFLVLALIVAVCGIVACGKKEEDKENPVSIVDGKEKESAKKDKEKNKYVGQDDLDPYTANVPNEIIDFYLEAIKQIEEAHKTALAEQIDNNPDFDLSSAKNLKYDLVFIDDNNTPELVVSNQSSYIALYTYDAGKVINAFGDDEVWTYGVGGNPGYEYAPKKNIIFNNSAEFAGMIRYYNYNTLNEQHMVEPLYEDGSLGEVHFEDKDKDGAPGEDEEYIEEPVKYLQGEKEITKKKFESLYIKEDFEPLTGTKSAEEIIALLNGLVNSK